MQFIDEAVIAVAAGKGGDGIVAWRREKYIPKGGPAGGDGGHGGSVYLQADSELSTLVEFRYKRSFAAESGKPGGTSNKSGKSGDDLTIAVPAGTLVYRTLEGKAEAYFADLAVPGERLLVAKGGRGGLGNQHFATSVRQAPRFAERGEPGDRCALRLELRLLADCGVIGVPNAGKSTLLSVVSAARPKVADYPFTTIEPQLGVVRVSDEESFVMVDVPGLIEGAHAGAGLGDQFLKHVERTRALVHLLDGAKPLDEILHDKTTIERELEAWNPKLLEKPVLLVLNKLDLPDARERLSELRERFPGISGISAATREGVRELVFAVDPYRRERAGSRGRRAAAGDDRTRALRRLRARTRKRRRIRVVRQARRTAGRDDELRLRRVARALRTRPGEDGRREEIARHGRRRRGYRAHRDVRIHVLMKLGIFGGTFDPIHNAHLFVAESARLSEGLDRVLFVPANSQHYRDRAHASVEHRCAMILGAIASNPAFALDDTDLREDATGYTADLIPRLAQRYPGAAFTFIIGADSLVNTAWVRFDEVLESLERFVIAPRPGVRADALGRVLEAVPGRLRDRVASLNLPEVPESASAIRALLSQVRSIRYLVPDAVWQYIIAQRLYGFGEA